MKILIDSNILVYAINQDSPKHKQVRKFLAEQFKSRKNQPFLAHQNILESLRVLTHPKFPNPISQNQGIQLLEQLLGQFTIISPLPETISIFRELWCKYHQRGNFIFDLYLVATALTHNIRIIATDNEKDLGQFEEINIINPCS